MTFGEYFEMITREKKLIGAKTLTFKVDNKHSEFIVWLFNNHTAINTKNDKEFYREKQLDKVFFQIDISKDWLEPMISKFLISLEKSDELEWV